MAAVDVFELAAVGELETATLPLLESAEFEVLLVADLIELADAARPPDPVLWLAPVL